MSHIVPIRRALISVSDKTDLVPFARSLTERGVEIISTGGTARALRDAGLNVIPVSDVTGFPEMMDGRVKTLHPAVHGALLARRDDPEHMQQLETHGMVPIDLVCINLYPFERTIRREGVTFDEAIEQIDIGGPTLLRSSAKNHDAVTVVTSAAQYDGVITELREHDGGTTLELRRQLAAAAFSRTAMYDTAISAWMSAASEAEFPSLLQLNFTHHADLRYGENPHQRAAIYADASAPADASVVRTPRHGKALSYNNVNDAAAALGLVRDLARTAPDRTAAAVIKHTNPCGAAVAATLQDAFDLAYAGDPMAAYGGILAVSEEIDAAVANRIAEGQRFLEVIVAPRFTPDAIETLGTRWKNVRLLEVGAVDATEPRRTMLRTVPGGLLVQQQDTKLANVIEWQHAAGPQPNQETLASAAVIWTVAKHLTSNAIAIGRDDALLGAGAGQMDRVASCRLALEKAADRIVGDGGTVIAASDAFFPFADGPEILIDGGVRCLVHPGGSKRDEETIALCEERGVTCLLTGVRHFRH